MRFGLRALSTALALVAGACGTPVDVDAGPEPAALECAAPLTIVLSPSVEDANRGVPTAAIAWTDERCALYGDETHPDALLVVADFQGALGAELVAARADRWVIDTSSVGSAPATYVGIPPDTDVAMELSRDELRVALTFRVEADTLVLVEMRL